MSEKDLIGVRVDEETMDIIESQLGYGDSKSGWVREAIEARIEKEGLAGNAPKTVMTAD